jgi:hemoglobin/transferrin/lactoferrin receptor protein
MSTKIQTIMKYKTFVLLFLALIFAQILKAQNVKIIDKTDLTALNEVYIFSGNNYVVTNEYGMAEISAFSPQDSILIQHRDYNTYKSSYEQLKNIDFFIRLTPNIIHVEEVIVSANRVEQNVKEVPNKIASIKKQEIEFYNPQTAADLLKISDEVFVQKSQLGGGSPMIRGYAANRVLLVTDNIRMNNAIFRSGNLQNVISLDPNAIENTEIIFGPGSVIYGSDAIGGVMNFSTLKAKISGSQNYNHSLEALTRYATANNEKTAHVHFNIGSEKWAFLSSFSYSNFGDLKMGTKKHEDYQRLQYAARPYRSDIMKENENPNVQKFTGYSQTNFMQKIRFAPNDKLDITYAFHISSTSDVPRYDRLTEYSGDTLKYAEWYYGPQKWNMHALGLSYDKANTLFDGLTLNLAAQSYQESRHDRKYGETTIRERFERVNAYSANIDFHKKFFDELKMFYGIELVNNKVYSNGQLRNIRDNIKTDYPSRYPDNSDYNSLAGYLSFSAPLKKDLNFSAGVRYNHISIFAPFDTTFYKFPFEEIDTQSAALTGSIGLTRQFRTNTLLSLNISTGFRAPNIDDLGKVFDSEPGNVIVPNPDLKPEYAYNADLGIQQHIADKFELQLSIFYSFLQDAIVRQEFTFNGQDSIYYDGELSRVQALVNAEQAYVYGAHFGIKANLTDFLAFKGNINYSKGEDSGGNPLRHVSPTFASTHLISTGKQYKIDFFLNWNAEIPYSELAESERSKTYMYAQDTNGNPYSPEWFTLNLNGTWQINKVFRLNAGIENILNHRYRPYSSGIVAPGRNFILSLSLKL